LKQVGWKTMRSRISTGSDWRSNHSLHLAAGLRTALNTARQFARPQVSGSGRRSGHLRDQFHSQSLLVERCQLEEQRVPRWCRDQRRPLNRLWPQSSPCGEPNGPSESVRTGQCGHRQSEGSQVRSEAMGPGTRRSLLASEANDRTLNRCAGVGSMQHPLDSHRHQGSWGSLRVFRTARC